MPGFITHYLFGVSTFRRADRHLFHKLVKKHPTAYALGLQGPDLFFYYPFGFRFSPNPASLAHSSRTTAFFHAMLKSRKLFRKREDYETILCYIFGFLGHYTLDTTCHPYIYDKTHFRERTPSYFGKHVYLETDIDAKLLLHYKQMLPSEFSAAQTLCLSTDERRSIARCLHFAYNKTYPGIHFSHTDTRMATLFMPLAIAMLRDPYGKKKVLIRRIERHFPGYPYASPLIASDTLQFTKDPLNLRHKQWKNPWNNSITSTDSFPDLFQKARNTYLKRIRLLELLIEADITANGELHSTKEQTRLKTFLASLGNRSYSTGLPL